MNEPLHWLQEGRARLGSYSHEGGASLNKGWKRLFDSRFRLSAQLNMAIWTAVILTVCAGVVAWLSLDRVGDAQTRVNEDSIPEMEAAFGVAQYSEVLVVAAPRLTSAVTTEEFDQASQEIDAAFDDFEAQLALLEERGVRQESFDRIRTDADILISNIQQLKDETASFFMLADETEALGMELASVRSRLDSIVVPAIDAQLFYTMTGYSDLGDPAAPREDYFSEEELRYYRHLAQLQADGNVATELLANAFTLSDASQIEPLRERFEAASDRIGRNLAALEGSPLQAEVAPIFNRLSELGIGAESGFDLLARRLQLAERQQDLVAQNRGVAVDLLEVVNGLVSTAQASAQQATQASSDAVLVGRILLLVITGISVGGAVLIAWLFIGRVLARRLKLLSDRMRHMAAGDLEAQVEVDGRDEVAEMAGALEVFRRHALEVQRLNLVERMAEELTEKNEQLETVLVDLQKAQDQIVMRDKLAALGELTAGVAHEIRNPLNFINNFSAASDELLTEMHEVLDEEDAQLTDEQRGLIEDIFGDLRGNMERIQTHGHRANRIVHDMLLMGRDAGVAADSDINNLLDEHARLAYHSARAVDPNFQLDLKHEFDPNMGLLEVIPQELGRVFLNMVSNACYATDQKRRAIMEGGDGSSYMPTLWLATERKEEHAEIRIRDNGNGIPEDVIEKIFNPFFTTKPTDQGTGLGLALSNDIVRRHGGSISVESEPGQFTEMTITLPLEPTATLALDAPSESDPEEDLVGAEAE